MKLEYEDLLGTPWELDGDRPGVGLDCAGVAAIVWERLGMLDDPEIFHARKRFNGELERIEDYFESMGRFFERIGDGYRAANKVGDLIFSSPKDPNFVTHIGVVVDAKQQLVLTAAYNVGVHGIKAYAIREVTGVYRRASSV